MKFELFCKILTQHSSGSERVKKQYPNMHKKTMLKYFHSCSQMMSSCKWPLKEINLPRFSEAYKDFFSKSYFYGFKNAAGEWSFRDYLFP